MSFRRLSSHDFYVDKGNKDIWLNYNKTAGVLFVTSGCRYSGKFQACLGQISSGLSIDICIVDISQNRDILIMSSKTLNRIDKVPRFVLYTRDGSGMVGRVQYNGPIDTNSIFNFISSHVRRIQQAPSPQQQNRSRPSVPISTMPQQQTPGPAYNNTMSPTITPVPRKDLSYTRQEQSNTAKRTESSRDPRAGLPTDSNFIPYNNPWKAIKESS